MTCRAPVPPLDPLFDTWAVGRVIHVMHETAFAPESFNPGVDGAGRLRKPTRFAPIRDAKGKVVPYLYGGSTLDCAIFETVFHDVPVDAADKFVDLDDFAQRGHGELIASRDLKLVAYERGVAPLEGAEGRVDRLASPRLPGHGPVGPGAASAVSRCGRPAVDVAPAGS